ncbi:hypothetical protein FQN60_000792 [Etheostoma spectabile]|uniref:Uncharacterized protein n=1 Tax=Etheostoma spectabile TaxID=54343 RepID=A0A5J5D2M4_9PERO|nr:hypothetical protein FQN60_000792 [Etheostoma spectabile]
MLLIGQSDGQVSFSHPKPEHMLLGSQLLATGSISVSPWQRLVRRMTRFFTTVNADNSLSALKTPVTACHLASNSLHQTGMVSTLDKRNNKPSSKFTC